MVPTLSSVLISFQFIFGLGEALSLVVSAGQTDVDLLPFSRNAADTDLPKLLQELRLQRYETADRFKNHFVHADLVVTHSIVRDQ